MAEQEEKSLIIGEMIDRDSHSQTTKTDHFRLCPRHAQRLYHGESAKPPSRR